MFSGASLAWKRVWGLLSLALLVANSVLAGFPVLAASAGRQGQFGVRSLPPGVVTYSFSEPPGVSSIVDDHTIDPRLVETDLHYTFLTSFGNYSFDKIRPYTMGFTYGSLVSRSAFLINASSPLQPSQPVVTQVSDTLFECRYVALRGRLPAGTVTFRAEFSRREMPKLSVALSGNETFGDFNIVWAVDTPAPFLRTEQDKTLRLGSSNMSLVPIAGHKAHIGTSPDPYSWDLWLTVDWEDAPFGQLYQTRFNWPGLLSGSGIVVSFPSNVSYLDPTIVATSSSGHATYLSPERKVFYDGDYYWVFYYSGDGSIKYGTSADGVSWSAPAMVPTSPKVSDGFDVKLWGGHFYLAYWIKEGSYTKFIKGSKNGNTVAWGPERTIVSYSSSEGVGVLWHVAIAVDSNGAPAVAGSFRNTDGNRLWFPALYIATDSTGSSWSERKNLEGSELNEEQRVGVVATGPNRYYVVYTYNSRLKGARVVDGQAVSEGQIDLLSSSSNEHSEAVDSSGNIRLVYAGSERSLRYCVRAAGGTSWSTPAEIKSSTSLNSLTLTLGLLYALNVLYIDDGMIKYTHSSNGSSWSASTTPFGTSFGHPLYVSSPENATTHATIPVTWTEGTASPYNVMFGYLAMPAGSSGMPPGDPWNRPGLSPYQEYFKQLTEYASPGSGLLTIRQTDLYLPGRGLDLSISRVFTTPYAFLNGSPYNFERYPWANLGDGWQLNFPWIGDVYLHLWDGQQYPMNWINDVFENHRGEHFKLVKQANGSYTLYTKSGTRYIFSSEKKLTTIVDRTGNNQIQFSYSGTNIIQITDTVCRTVTLSYDSNGRLTSVHSGQRTTQYGYLNNKLVNVTDPAGRTTHYKYDTGANNWLINGTVYPTGGHTSFVYEGSPIGVNLVTYLVTLQNQYPSGEALSRSTSFNYTLRDGTVTKTEAAQAGSDASMEAYVYYGFDETCQASSRTTLDANKKQLNKVTTFYDRSGAVIQEDVYRGNATSKTYSNYYGYDSWGNLIYSKDAKGHEAFWAYANTAGPGLNSWNCRKRFNVTGQPGTGTDYQIKVVVHRTSGADSGKDVYVGTKCRSDFGDIRFTKADKETLMDYWIESKTDTEAVFWVEVSEDLGSDRSLYMYYGSSEATTTSNFDKTFIFGDPWDNSTLDATRWSNVDGNPTYSINATGHYLEVTNMDTYQWYAGKGFHSRTLTFPPQWIVEDAYNESANGMKHWHSSSDGYEIFASGISIHHTTYGSSDYGIAYAETRDFWCASKALADSCGIGGNEEWSSGGMSKPLPYETRWKFYKLSGTIYIDQDGTQRCSEANSETPNVVHLYIDQYWAYGFGTKRFYAFKVRKYCSPEPSISGWGSEEVPDRSPDFVRPDGTKPGFTRSFYSNSVDEKIHDLLVGKAESQDGSRSIEAYHKYDSAGNLLEEKALHNGGWLYTKHTYDIYGNRLSTTDANNHTTQYSYSPTYQYGYLTKVSNLVGGSNITRSYSYNFQTGDLLSETDPLNHTTTYQYDVLGRLTSVTYPPVGGVSASKTYAYDDINNILTTTNENGHVVKQYYDGSGRLTKIERYNGSQAYSTETYSHNWLDKVENHTTTTGSLYTYDYDALGRLVNTSNPDGTCKRTTYDDVGMTATNIDENGHKKTYGYDELSRLVWVKEYLQPTSPYVTRYTYDQVGNLLRITQGQPNSSWLRGWSYRKQSNVKGQSGAGTGYQVQIIAHYGSGTDSGKDVYLDSRCRTDFGDIRFTDDDGETLLNYWMERKTDGDYAILWVKVVDNLDSNQSIYIYYGKSDATTTSNGPNTFIFFDDFSGDLSKWTAGNSGLATPSIVSGELKLTGTGSGGNYWWSWGWARTGTVATGADSFKVHAKLKGTGSDTSGHGWEYG